MLLSPIHEVLALCVDGAYRGMVTHLLRKRPKDQGLEVESLSQQRVERFEHSADRAAIKCPLKGRDISDPFVSGMAVVRKVQQVRVFQVFCEPL